VAAARRRAQDYISKGCPYTSDSELRVNFAEGAAIAILLPLVLLLTGILSSAYTVTAILLLFGAWSIIFALVMALPRERLYYGSWGAILMALSSITVLPFRYTVALVLAVIIALIVLVVAMRQGRRAQRPAPSGQ